MASEITSLEELYIDYLEELYSAENQIAVVLPKIINKVHSPELKKGLEDHLVQILNQVTRLDQIFAGLEANPQRKKCADMKVLFAKGTEVLPEKKSSPGFTDAALIAACQKIDYYEISGYGIARAFADLLGDRKAVKLLTQTLDEEKAADVRLAQFGMNTIL